MPNGGSDCCGTCWFNKANHGKKGCDHRDDSIEPYCRIRRAAIKNPFYTYCANHPHRRPSRDPIPIGPILVHKGWGPGEWREVWVPSPDSEVIRLHLLALIHDAHLHAGRDRYPAPPGLVISVIRQLGEFREVRAVERLEWLARKGPLGLTGEAHKALMKIRPAHQNGTS